MLTWTVEPLTLPDLEFCLQLEALVLPSAAHAAEVGFLIPSSTPGEIETLIGSARGTLLKSQGRPCGFLLALPPGHPRLQRLLAAADRFDLEDAGILSLNPLGWVAKVAVLPELARHGGASALYEELFRQCPEVNFMTSTLLAPLRNIPSERLQERFGFKLVGKIRIGNRGSLKDCIGAVHLRRSCCFNASEPQ